MQQVEQKSNIAAGLRVSIFRFSLWVNKTTHLSCNPV